MKNNIILSITAQLDKIKSKLQMQKDLDTISGLGVKVSPVIIAGTKSRLQQELDALKNLTIEVQAELDRIRAQEDISRSLDNISASIQVNADLDPANITAMQKQIATAQSDFALDEYGSTSSIINRYELLSRIWDSAEASARQLIDTTVELDAKLTDLRMVTGDSYEDAYKLVDGYNNLAKRLGSTTSEVLDASSEWLRQGKTTAEATALIEQSVMLSKVGAMDSSTATQRLTSALNGYQMAASRANEVADKLTSLDLSAAVSSDELAESLSRTASSASLAGVSLDKILSYITVVEETTRKSASTIGESFKSIFSRMGKVTNGEAVDDFGEDISQVESTLRGFGIELRETETEFRDFDKVLDDVGTRWKEFSSVDQRKIASAFAGVYQSENFLALMNNYDKVAEYVDIAANSAGTAEKKFAAYEESIAAHANAMKAAFESLSMDTLDSGLVNGILDVGSAALAATENFGLLKAALFAVATMGAAQGLQFLATNLGTVYTRVAALTEAVNLLKATGTSNMLADDFSRLQQLASGLSTAQLQLVVSSQALTNEQRTAILTAGGLSAAEAQQTLSTMGLTAAEGSATAATFSFSGAMEALNLAISTNPIGLLVTVLSAGIAIITTYTNSVKQASEEAKAALQGLNNEIQQLQQASAGLQELAARYDELSSIAERTAEEQQEFLSVQNQLKELLPEVSGYYDEQGNFILAEGQSLESLMQTYQEYLQARRQELSEAYIQRIESETSAYQRQADEIARLTEYVNLYHKMENGENLNHYESDYLNSQGYTGELAASSFLSDYGMVYGGITEAQERLNQLQSEQVTILNDLRDGTVSLLSAQSEWYELTTDQQNEIRSALSNSGYAETKALFDSLIASGADFSAILSDLVQKYEVFHAELSETPNTATEIDGLSDSIAALEGQIQQLNDAEADYIKITEAVSNKHNLTTDEVTDLCSRYDGLQDCIKMTADGWQLESKAMDIVDGSLSSLQNAYISAQRTMNEILNSGIKSRLEMLGIELAGIRSLSDAYAAISGGTSTTYEKAVKNGNIHSWDADPTTYYDYKINGKELPQADRAAVLSLGYAQDTLARTEARLKSLMGSVGSGNIGSAASNKSGGSSRSTEKVEDVIKTTTNEALAIMEHEIFAWEKKGGFEKEIIAQYQKMQALVGYDY